MKYSRIVIIAALFVAAACIITQGGTRRKHKPNRPAVIGYFMSITSSKSEYPSARRAAKVLTHLCPTRVAIADTEGNVKFGKDNYIIALCKENGIALLPLAVNGEFSKEIGHAILSDPAKRTKVIAQLLDITHKWRAPGINIDLEDIDYTDRQNLNDFMQELSDKFHAEGLAVTIDVAAKTQDAPGASWAGCYDYEFLGKCCDMVMLMCYDEHWSSGHAGPIGSKPWVRKVLQYTVSVIPPEKVVLGVPFYGREWAENGRSRSVSSTRGQKLLADTKAKLQWDNIAKCHWFEYTDDAGVKRTVYFESEESLKHRIALAQEFKLAGISIWCLGNEDPDFWKLLAQYRAGKKVLK